MFPPTLSFLWLLAAPAPAVLAQICRNVPGSDGFPTDDQWQALNQSVAGHLVRAVPSGQYCRQVNCTDDEWTSANWRNTVPGAMNYDFNSIPPSLCWRTTPQTCGQGDVPIYAILAENAEDIQAGVNFARRHNLRLSVKSSGHDLLGRSTAKNSLLIHTHKLQSIEFTDSFQVGNVNLGSAVTVGSGVGLSALYNATKEVGKIYIGGTAATVVAAGGYIQGGGHSQLSPLFGMASDNVLEFNIVTADGVVRKVNNAQNHDLFWALRGGGAGSWGVIVNATFKTYPTFQTTRYTVVISGNDSATAGAICEAHARHIFDLDSERFGQNLGLSLTGPPNTGFNVAIDTLFPNSTAEQAVKALTPLFRDIYRAGGVLLVNSTNNATINELLAVTDDMAGASGSLGSRLIPESVYRKTPEAIGNVCKQLIDVGTSSVGAIIVGGKVAKNAYINSALNPGWRTAKSHLLLANVIPENGTVEEIRAAEHMFKNVQLPILEAIQGPTAAAYSNEADAFEEKWQSVFYGKNYGRLSDIKRQYDPTDLFIVPTGVGSERWDSYGLCRVST